MNKLATLILSLAFVFGSHGYGKSFSEQELLNVIDAAAKEAGVPSYLLRSICRVESSLNPTAFVSQDGGSGNHAFGLCQVLRSTAEKFVGKDAGCERNFKTLNIGKTPKNCQLFAPKVNALAAGKFLKSLIVRYKGDLKKATAAYNAGSVRPCMSGEVRNKAGIFLYKCKIGGILNQKYVDKVNKHLPQDFFSPTSPKEQIAQNQVLIPSV